MEFGNNLKTLLDERKLSQKELAADLNIAASTIGNYIRGLREPDYKTLIKIAEYFGVSVDFLLGMQIAEVQDHYENTLLQIYRSLNKGQKLFLIEQAKLLFKQRWDNT